MAKTKKRPYVDMTLVVLRVLAVTGIIAMILVAPNTAQLLPHLFPSLKRQRRYYIRTVVQRLIERGFVEKIERDSSVYVQLTPKGRKELERYQVREKMIQKPKRWDGKFRLIIFDIHERQRTKRDELRIWLSDLGFVRLQQSVWVYPYECEEVITLLKTYFQVGKAVLYVTAEAIENDYWLKRHFGLLKDG